LGQDQFIGPQLVPHIWCDYIAILDGAFGDEVLANGPGLESSAQPENGRQSGTRCQGAR